MRGRPLSQKVGSIAESQTLALSARAAEMKREGIDIISLTAGEPDFPTPQHIKEAGIEAIESNFTRYTPNNGIPELLEAISIKFHKENNLHWSPSEILVSSGAKHSVFNALQAILEPGDEVLIVSPYWVSYPEMVKLIEGVPIIIKSGMENHFKITPEMLERAITPRSKVFIFNSPSNPTGAVYSNTEVEALSDVIAKHELYVISDEIYEHLIFDGQEHVSIGSYDSVRDLTITVNGTSKSFSMTGWRLGYLGARKDRVALASTFQGQVTSNASSISQHAALIALTSPLDAVWNMRDKIQERRNYLVKALNSINGIECLIPAGAFYVFPKVSSLFGKYTEQYSIQNDAELCEYLLVEGKVAAIPGSAFGAPEYLRLSYTTSTHNLKTAIERIGESLAKLRS
jgi:aspartate aminotransferase